MKLKRNELRIGNLIETDNGNIIKCDYVNRQVEKFWKPIKLNNDWFKKFKAQKNDIGNYWFYIDECTYIEFTETDAFYPMLFQIGELSHEGDSYISLNRIHFVHQLQNLYYTLTGQELKLN